MSIVNFSEIPIENTEEGISDEFELFARDFLESYGFKTIAGPDRGSDLGRDLIVEEQLEGVVNHQKFRWLVSCKHYTKSGKSVGINDENDIQDRVQTHDCQGFLGFYSTIPSNSLKRKLEGFDSIEFEIFDKERISQYLFRSADGIKLFERYLPDSFRKYNTENPRPSNIYEKEFELRCDHCGKNLLEIGDGVLAFCEEDNFVEEIYTACKGKCDRVLQNHIKEKGLSDHWDQLSNLKRPLGFLRWALKLHDHTLSKYDLNESSKKKLKSVVAGYFQQVSRNQTNQERKRDGQPSSLEAI